MGETAPVIDASQTIGEIRTLAESMLQTPEEERPLVYRQLNRCFLDLEGLPHVRMNPQTLALLDRLKVHLIALARLDDPDQLTDEQHGRMALETVDALGHLLGH